MKCNYELKKNTSTVVKRQGMYKALTITLISLPPLNIFWDCLYM